MRILFRRGGTWIPPFLGKLIPSPFLLPCLDLDFGQLSNRKGEHSMTHFSAAQSFQLGLQLPQRLLHGLIRVVVVTSPDGLVRGALALSPLGRRGGSVGGGRTLRRSGRNPQLPRARGERDLSQRISRAAAPRYPARAAAPSRRRNQLTGEMAAGNLTGQMQADDCTRSGHFWKKNIFPLAPLCRTAWGLRAPAKSQSPNPRLSAAAALADI